jgi:hypothetical protein
VCSTKTLTDLTLQRRRSPSVDAGRCAICRTVQVIPALTIVKSADPTRLLGGGDVTYTYQVRNTGAVPLADVATRITDDTCSPVAYVAGRLDGDDHLETPTSARRRARAS